MHNDPNLMEMTDAEVGTWINETSDKTERSRRKAVAYYRLNRGTAAQLAAALTYPPDRL